MQYGKCTSHSIHRLTLVPFTVVCAYAAHNCNWHLPISVQFIDCAAATNSAVATCRVRWYTRAYIFVYIPLQLCVCVCVTSPPLWVAATLLDINSWGISISIPLLPPLPHSGWVLLCVAPQFLSWQRWQMLIFISNSTKDIQWIK